VIELGRGAWEGWAGLRLPISEGLSGQVITTGRPYLNNDAVNNSPRARLEPIGELQAIACVPLIAQDETIGALWVGRSTPIQGNEMHLIHAIADIAANGIRRATLFEQTERRLQHLTALRTIDRAITTSLDLRVTLDILLDHVTAQLNVHAADIFLFDPATQTLEFTAGRGFRSIGITRSHLRVGEGYAGRAILERKPLHLSNMVEAGPNKVITPALAGEGFVSYYGLPLITKGQIKGVLEVFHRARFVADPEWLDFLETLAGQAAIAIENAQLFDNLQRSNIKLTLAYDATIEGWSRALELRDKETEGHSQRVTEMTLHLGREMGMNEAELVHVRRGALLHDIGKMGIPDSILLRPGPLSSDEWEIMRMHPKYANDMLMPIDYLRLALDIPYCHHEKWDGTGYPRGLKGKQIPLAARIFMIADVWDAVNSDRPYGQAWHRGKALAYIKEQSGFYFDPQVVEIFLKLYPE
jgi:HD-GYP domain-containing protein (c-di-GMP phosphodiesterase class II)